MYVRTGTHTDSEQWFKEIWLQKPKVKVLCTIARFDICFQLEALLFLLLFSFITHGAVIGGKHLRRT